MADLIDRQAAIKLLFDGFAEYWELPCLPSDIIIQRNVGEVRDEIKALPTVDAVEVVRCKDCKHQEECMKQLVFWGRDHVLEMNTYQYHKLDFCSYGERRTNDA